jgi:hypothetical protein
MIENTNFFGVNNGGNRDHLASAPDKLPKGETEWPAEQRVTWLQMIAMAFDLAYGPAEKIHIGQA